MLRQRVTARWPLSADSWEAQMLFLAGNGYRCIAHDRRGHGRSSQTWNGNDMDIGNSRPTPACAMSSSQCVPTSVFTATSITNMPTIWHDPHRLP